MIIQYDDIAKQLSPDTINNIIDDFVAKEMAQALPDHTIDRKEARETVLGKLKKQECVFHYSLNDKSIYIRQVE